THLEDLNRTPGFRKSVTLKPELAAVEQLISSDKNAWRDLVAKWHLADSVPYAVAAKPSPRALAEGEQQLAAREHAEAERLEKKYGVIKDGKAIPFEQMSEMLRKEILSLNSYFSTNFRTGRAELVVRGAGNDAAESQRAIQWMKLVLTSPDWRVENIARIRDVVDQTLSA